MRNEDFLFDDDHVENDKDNDKDNQSRVNQNKDNHKKDNHNKEGHDKDDFDFLEEVSGIPVAWNIFLFFHCSGAE